jgi:hypothetical protein
MSNTRNYRPWVILALSLLVGLIAADASYAHGRGCCAPIECCQPAPRMVSHTLCLVDPCTCCTAEAEVCIPEHCCGEVPCITWRWGLFGRRIATVCWTCCDYSVEVVVTKFGRVIVRD